MHVADGERLAEHPNAWRTLLSETGANSIVVAVQGHAHEQRLLKSLQQSGARFTKFVALPATGAASQGARPAHRGIGPVGQAIKASLDFVAAIGLLIALAPLLLLIAALVKLDSGPVLFRHERVGQHGRTFYCLKFRTMVVDADQALQSLLARHSGEKEWTIPTSSATTPG